MLVQYTIIQVILNADNSATVSMRSNVDGSSASMLIPAGPLIQQLYVGRQVTAQWTLL